MQHKKETPFSLFFYNSSNYIPSNPHFGQKTDRLHAGPFGILKID